jgi:hypothetical protein
MIYTIVYLGEDMVTQTKLLLVGEKTEPDTTENIVNIMELEEIIRRRRRR